MKYLGPTSHARLNEAVGFVFLFAALFVFASLATYDPFDPSWDTATGSAKVFNLTGRVGAFAADLCFQAFGLAAYAIPVLILLLGWKWMRSSPLQAPGAKTLGAATLVIATCAGFGIGPEWKPIAGLIPAGGQVGAIAAEYLIASMNVTGAALFTAACWIVSIYLVSTFEVSRLSQWFARPIGWMQSWSARCTAWLKEQVRQRAEQRARAAEQQAREKDKGKDQPAVKSETARAAKSEPAIIDPLALAPVDRLAPAVRAVPATAVQIEDIPIHALELLPLQGQFEEVPAAAAPALPREDRNTRHP